MYRIFIGEIHFHLTLITNQSLGLIVYCKLIRLPSDVRPEKPAFIGNPSNFNKTLIGFQYR